MRALIFLIYLAIISACVPKVTFSPDAILISDVHIVDVATGEILEHKNIVVDSGRIEKILDDIKSREGFAEVINGNGGYIIPGLAEMHAHIPPPTTSRERIEETLFLYLSNGITTIRGMLGDPTHLALRTQAENGEILSPRIFTSSPSLNGNSVTSIEEADAKVRKYKADGYDFLKIHPGILRPVFDQVVTTANEVGIPFAGHVPVDVGIRHALESKYASIDHVDGFLEGLVPDSLEMDPNSNGFFGYNFTPFADTTLIAGLVEMAKENQVWIIPTQSLFERWFAPISVKDLAEQKEMKYMPGSTVRAWIRSKNQISESETFNESQWQDFDKIRKHLIKALQKNGHGMLLGSGAPQVFNVPGFSIHHEMDGMKKAGMSNLEIIQSGTMNPAIYFGKENEFGQIKEGLAADFMLIRDNPLQELDALKNPDGVMRQGRWVSAEEINKALEEIAKNAGGQ